MQSPVKMGRPEEWSRSDEPNWPFTLIGRLRTAVPTQRGSHRRDSGYPAADETAARKLKRLTRDFLLHFWSREKYPPGISPMTPYIKANSPLRGDRKPRVPHGPGLPHVQRRQKEEVAATRRALKKAARREGKREIEEAF